MAEPTTIPTTSVTPHPSTATTPPPAAAPPKPEAPPKPTGTTDTPASSAPLTQEDEDLFEKAWQARTGKKAETTKDEPPPETPPKEAPKAPLEGQKPAKDALQDKSRMESGPKALREERDRVLADLRAEREAHSRLKASLAEHETRAKEAAALAEENAKIKKEVDNLKGRLQAVQFEVSDDFKAKYETPFNDAAEIAQQEIEQFPINVMDAEGNIASQRRSEFGKDFAGIYNLDYISAKSAAQKMWGDEWQVVMQHWSRLHSLSRQRDKAMESERTNWKARQQEREAETAKQREAMESVRAKVWQDVSKKHPEWFGEDPNDPEGNELLKEGYELINTKPKTMQEQLVHWANTLHRAAAFPRMAAKYSKLAEENASLKAKIEELKGGAPGPTKTSGSTSQGQYLSIADELRKEFGQ